MRTMVNSVELLEVGMEVKVLGAFGNPPAPTGGIIEYIVSVEEAVATTCSGRKLRNSVYDFRGTIIIGKCIDSANEIIPSA